MDARERTVVAVFAALYCVAAVLIAVLLPSERDVSLVLVAALLLGHAAVSQVRFEFGMGFVVPEQLVVIPMLLLLPLPYVPILIAAAGALGLVPDFIKGSWAKDRWLKPIADSWSYLAPVLILAAFAPGPPELSSAPVYALAIAAQLGTDFAQAVIRNRLLDGVPTMELARCFVGATRVELVLSPIALVATLAAYEEPLVLVAVIAPLVWLLDNFSKDRAARYASALELNRAYRGTVMLLSDVLEFEDEYTAQHSRSVVDLVNAVADELGIAPDERQELEFAAMLHDVGKISIPKEILHKPAALTGHRVRGHQAPHDRGSVHARPCWRTARPSRRGRPLVPRALGRTRLSGWPGRRGDPDRRSDRVRVRRLQRDDHRPALPPGDVSRSRGRRAGREHRGAVRSRRSSPRSPRWSRTGNPPPSRASRGSVLSWPAPRFRRAPAQPRASPRRASCSSGSPPRRGARRCSTGPTRAALPAPATRRTVLTPRASMSPPAARNAAANAQALSPSRTPNVRAIRLSSTVVWMSRRS